MEQRKGLVRVVAVAVLIGVLAPSLVARCFTAGYLHHWDDGLLVLGNPIAEKGLNAAGLEAAFAGPFRGEWTVPGYLPLTFVSFGIEHALFGQHPALSRLINLLLHLATALLLWRLITKFLPRIETNYAAWAGLPVLLFAVHPTNVESVAWITERNNVLAAFFAMAALCVLARRHPFSEAEAAFEPPGVGRWLGAWALFALACLSKGSAVAWAPALMGFEILMVRGSLVGRLGRALSFLVLGGLCAWVNMKTYASVDVGPVQGDFGRYFMTAVSVLGYYALNLCWPFKLAYAYAVPPVLTPTEGPFLIGLAVAVVGIVALFWAVLQTRAALLMVLWVFGSLGLFLMPRGPGLAPLMHDRFLYWALPGIAMGLALMQDGLFCRFGYVMNFMEQVARGFALVLYIALAGLFGWQACNRSAVFSDEIALFEDSIRKEPRSGLGRYWLADQYVVTVLEGGESLSQEAKIELLESALEHIRAARLGVNIERHPAPLLLEHREGTILFMLGQLDKAVPFFEKMLAVPAEKLRENEKPSIFEAHYALAEIARMQNPPDWSKAMHHLDAALKDRPTHTRTLQLKAQALEAMNRIPEAIEVYRILKEQPEAAEAASKALSRLAPAP
ncbi:MAG: hypothetical protein HS116_13675 [Planctomycetes bacterium]|nr:hypothetical protein [Planctomycetota bacterium]